MPPARASRRGGDPRGCARALCPPDICHRLALCPPALLSDRVLAFLQRFVFQEKHSCFKTPCLLLPCFSTKCSVVSARLGFLPLPPLPCLPSSASNTVQSYACGAPGCRRPHHPAEASRLVLAVPLLACPPPRLCLPVLPLQKAARRGTLTSVHPGPSSGPAHSRCSVTLSGVNRRPQRCPPARVEPCSPPGCTRVSHGRSCKCWGLRVPGASGCDSQRISVCLTLSISQS